MLVITGTSLSQMMEETLEVGTQSAISAQPFRASKSATAVVPCSSAWRAATAPVRFHTATLAPAARLAAIG